MASLTINYSIPFGSSIRIGYKIIGSLADYTYLNVFPNYNQSPYTIPGVPLGTYQIQLNTICPTCTGGQFSDPLIVNAVGV